MTISSDGRYQNWKNVSAIVDSKSGRKVELVVLAYGPNQLGADKERSSIENKVKNKQDYRYLTIELLKINDDTIPDILSLKVWMSEESNIT